MAYAAAHAQEVPNIVAAIETDLGVGPVNGFGFSGTDAARMQLHTLLQALPKFPTETRIPIFLFLGSHCPELLAKRSLKSIRRGVVVGSTYHH